MLGRRQLTKVVRQKTARQKFMEEVLNGKSRELHLEEARKHHRANKRRVLSSVWKGRVVIGWTLDQDDRQFMSVEEAILVLLAEADRRGEDLSKSFELPEVMYPLLRCDDEYRSKLPQGYWMGEYSRSVDIDAAQLEEVKKRYLASKAKALESA